MARRPPKARVEAVLLAGGLSQRMGRDKARIRVSGRSLLSRSADAPCALGLPVRVLRHDAVPRCGPLGGIHTALNQSRSEVILFLSCDMPLVPPRLLERLLTRLGSACPAAFIESEGWVGFPFALRTNDTVRNIVRRHLGKTSGSLQELATDLGAVRLQVPPRDRGLLLNVNTPEALAALRAALAAQDRPTQAGMPSAKAPTPPPVPHRTPAAQGNSNLRKSPPSHKRPHPANPFLAGIVGTLITVFGPTLGLAAGLPHPDRWLPTNTAAYLSIPNANAVRTAWPTQPPGRFWSDPAMAAFRSQTESRAARDFWMPWSQLTGYPLRTLPMLAQGQVTLAWLDESPPRAIELTLRPLLVLEGGTNAPALQAWLTNAPTPDPTTELTIQDVRFLRRDLPQPAVQAALNRILPEIGGPRATPAGEAAASVPLYIGQWQGVLLASTSTNALAGALQNLTVPSSPPDPNAAGTAVTLLQGSVALPRFLKSLSSTPLSLGAFSGPDDGPSLARVASALGLDPLRTASWAIRSEPEGWFFNLRLAVPPEGRRGLLSLFPLLPADAAPPPSIPASARGFLRVRVPGPTTWARFEKMLRDIDPSFLGVLQMFTGYAGKTDDADFDFQKGIIDRLGDDWLWASMPTPTTPQPASLFVLSSPQATELYQGLRLVASPTYLATFFPPDSDPPRRLEHQLQGSPVTSIALPPMPWNEGATGALHFAHHDGRIAFSSDLGVLAGFLSTNAPASPLALTPGFRNFALKTDGTGHGYFGYADERHEAARLFAAFARSPHALSDHFSWIAFSPTATRLVVGVEGWLDPTLLPPFDEVAHHFGPRFTSGKLTAQGYEWTSFRPALKPPR